MEFKVKPMRKLLVVSAVVIISGIVLSIFAFRSSESPHGRNFKMECSDCHTSDGWKMRADARFNHNTATSFGLEGQHAQVNCKSCHSSLVFSEASRDCNQCHNDVHEQNLGTDCNRCHNPNGWIIKNITEIHQQSRFPLVGAHVNADCYQCHKSENLLRFESIGIECMDCHMDKYQATEEPKHDEAGFSTVCSDCHSVRAYEWGASGFSHAFFPLTQGHNIDDCTKCHEPGKYGDTDPACVSCHQDDFNTTQNPDHVASNFSQECDVCHTTAPGWKPAKFDHNDFPLTLGHKINDCTKCHINGEYKNTSSECVDCHKEDYNNAKEPPHTSKLFTTQCTDCHTTNPGWEPTTFKHDPLFPIYSGKHKGEWNKCTDCHNNASDYSIFTCIDCHEHNKSKMDSKHNEERDYQYNSAACFDCHPTGRAED